MVRARVGARVRLGLGYLLLKAEREHAVRLVDDHIGDLVRVRARVSVRVRVRVRVRGRGRGRGRVRVR